MGEDARVCAGGDCMGDGIIFGTAMAEKRLETGEVRYSAAYPTGRERIVKVTPLPCGLSTMVLLYQ